MTCEQKGSDSAHGAGSAARKGRKPDARTLAQQLRANLRRRKRQARARAGEPDAGERSRHEDES